MKVDIFRKLIVLVISGLINATASGSVSGLTTYVLGGKDHPWGECDPKLGGAIDRIDMTRDPGWIQPVEVDSTEKMPLMGAMIGNEFSNVFLNEPQNFVTLIDGDPNTALVRELSLAGKVSTNFLAFDLGAPFTVNRIRFFPREQFRERFLTQFRIEINDGSPASVDEFGRVVLDPIVIENENTNPVVDVKILPQTIRYIMLLPVVMDEPWEIAEFEVFGQGYVSEASYTSNIIDFNDVANWGKIRWDGTIDPGAKVLIQTRSGIDEDPNVYWRKTGKTERTGRREQEVPFSELGEPLTKKDYYSLRPNVQGRITYDSDNWSFWSPPYDFEAGRIENNPDGVSIVSPGPRRFFQLKITFLPAPTAAGKIDFVEFQLSKPPMAEDIVAEIFPLDVRPVEVTTFTYALRPRIKAGNTGFDGLEITAPVRVEGIRSVRIDHVDVAFTPLVEEDRFVVSFPRIEIDGTLLEVIFDARVFTYGTVFRGRVFDSQSEEVPQLVNPGDATLDLDGNDLSVRTSLGGSLIRSVQVFPNPVTPNGDGFNDVVDISYSLLQLTGTAPVSVRVYDLSGTLMRTVYSGRDVSGLYSRTWDSSDDGGNLVPPGIYLYRISVDADEGQENAVGTIYVAY